MTQITHWINGALDTHASQRSGEVFNPATGKVTKTVAFADVATVDRAVNAATEAFATWRHSSLTKRTQVLFAFRELVQQNKEKIAALITDEHGKVLSDAAGEVTRGLEVVEFACGIPHLLKGGFSEEVSSGVDVYSIRQALGPVAIISPFNFPAMVPMWFFPVAIACGNTVVVKPSEKDPSAAMFMAQLWKEAGLPDGVFNVVHGDKEAVDAFNTANEFLLNTQPGCRARRANPIGVWSLGSGVHPRARPRKFAQALGSGVMGSGVIKVGTSLRLLTTSSTRPN